MKILLKFYSKRGGRIRGKRTLVTMLASALLFPVAAPHGSAQTAGDTRPRIATSQPQAPAATETRLLNAGRIDVSAEEAAIQSQISSVYQNFYSTYRLGAGDVIAVRVDKHPEDSVERAVVSPVGQIYHPLLGNVAVAGKTLDYLQHYFTTSIADYIRGPRVTLSLVEANSSKIGILGDVRTPGVMIMARPMRVLDAITAAGGVTETGDASKISILRQHENGRVEMLSIDMKKILKGKADPEENAALRAGDTIIVHGNLFKKLGKVSSLLGLTSFVMFLGRGGR